MNTFIWQPENLKKQYNIKSVFDYFVRVALKGLRKGSVSRDKFRH